jgi:hypothetical protein
MSEEIKKYVKYPNSDFTQVQNYALQLVADKKLTTSEFVLYSFINSIKGYTRILCSFDYYSANTGLSKGIISKAFKTLEVQGLLTVIRHGIKKSLEVILVPGTNLPRRTLYSSGKIKVEKTVDIDNNFVAQSIATSCDILSLSKDAYNFWEAFKQEWKNRAKTDLYPKDDLYKIKEIDNYKEAIKLIPVMWIMDDQNDWVRKSDHTLSVFAKLWNDGSLQELYPKTSLFSLK